MPTAAYTPELAAAICDHLAAGKSLRQIEQLAGMPSARSVYRWLADDAHEAFRQQYAQAREEQADYYLDDILSIADDSSQDTLRTDKGDFENKEWVNRSKLRVDARKWVMSKLAPKKYGDKLDVTSGGDKLPSAFEVRVVAAGPPLAGSEKEVHGV